MTKTERMRSSRFTVAGVGAFPLDMLRYDRCFPQTQVDVAAMSRVRGERVARHVCLESVSVGDPRPTLRRWESFGWKVTMVDGEALGGCHES